MKYFIAVMLCVCLLSSCGSLSADVGPGIKNEPTQTPRAPSPSDYGKTDIKYTACVSDGNAVVCFEAERVSDITTARITEPAEMAGTVITDDVDGARIVTGGCELPVSAELACGLDVIFGLMSTLPEDACVTQDGAYAYTCCGVLAELWLSDGGMPERARLSCEGYERQVNFTYGG